MTNQNEKALLQDLRDDGIVYSGVTASQWFSRAIFFLVIPVLPWNGVWIDFHKLFFAEIGTGELPAIMTTIGVRLLVLVLIIVGINFLFTMIHTKFFFRVGFPDVETLNSGGTFFVDLICAAIFLLVTWIKIRGIFLAIHTLSTNQVMLWLKTTATTLSYTAGLIMAVAAVLIWNIERFQFLKVAQAGTRH